MALAKKPSNAPIEAGGIDLRMVLEHIVQGVVVLDADGRVRIWNAHYQELMAFPDDVLKVGESVHDLGMYLARRGDYGPGDPRELQKKRIATLWKGRVTRSEYRTQDGRIYDVLAEPTPEGWLVVSYTDITERGRAEAELIAQRDLLQDLDRQKQRFFSIIAHDLRSPFNALLGNAQMIAGYGQKLSRSRLQDYAQSINQSGEQLLRLLDNLLDWSRSQTGQIPFEPQPLKLQAVVAEGLEVLAMFAEQKSIALVTEVEKVTVMADRLMLETILRNLVNNALKFTPRGGQVTVAARQVSGDIELTVSDTGVGMTREQAEHLFRFDAGAVTEGTEGEHGTGLGLLICRDFVNRHDGILNIQSEPGQGSSFRFVLPPPPRANPSP